MLCYIRDTPPVYSEINLANADNSGGYVIGQLYRHTRGDNAVFLVVGTRRVDYHPTKMPWDEVEIFINNCYGTFKKRRFDELIRTGEIELVK